MKPTALIRCAAAAAAAVLVATACGTSETEPGTPVAESSETSTTTATTSAAAAPSRERIAPRQESTQGPATTIADYIAENDIEVAIPPLSFWSLVVHVKLHMLERSQSVITSQEQFGV